MMVAVLGDGTSKELIWLAEILKLFRNEILIWWFEGLWGGGVLIKSYTGGQGRGKKHPYIEQKIYDDLTFVHWNFILPSSGKLEKGDLRPWISKCLKTGIYE